MSNMRIGHGYDVHRFGEGDSIVLCGVRIPHSHASVSYTHLTLPTTPYV